MAWKTESYSVENIYVRQHIWTFEKTSIDAMEIVCSMPF